MAITSKQSLDASRVPSPLALLPRDVTIVNYMILVFDFYNPRIIKAFYNSIYSQQIQQRLATSLKLLSPVVYCPSRREKFNPISLSRIQQMKYSHVILPSILFYFSGGSVLFPLSWQDPPVFCLPSNLLSFSLRFFNTFQMVNPSTSVLLIIIILKADEGCEITYQEAQGARPRTVKAKIYQRREPFPGDNFDREDPL